MENKTFPVFKTKGVAGSPRYKLEDPAERRKYFEAKARPEIEKIRAYLDGGNTFVGFLLGKKNSGKGTYAKLFMEAIGVDRVAHISVGDIVRDVHKSLETEADKRALVSFLEKRYRGFITIEKALDVILGRDTATLLPTEIILALVEREMARLGRKAVFIDGFPRNLDQVSYSLYFRTLMGYRDDPDFFVFIHVPESIIDERMKHRVICPSCHTPRNPRLLRTKDIGYDAQKKEFFLICDHPACPGPDKRMVSKEGDSLGIEAIRDRIEVDENVMRTLLDLQGVSKIYLRNAVPVASAQDVVDDYEITPGYRYALGEDQRTVRVIEEPWIVKDDEGVESYSLLPAAIVVSFIKQTAKVLGF